MHDEMRDYLMGVQGQTVEQILREADHRDLLEPALENLSSRVAETLRAIVAGERPGPALSPGEIALLGATIGQWGVPSGRSTLAPFGRPLTAEELVEHGLTAEQSARVEAVVGWPIGFTREDLARWGLLSSEQAEAVWEYIEREHGLYATGIKYAVP